MMRKKKSAKQLSVSELPKYDYIDALRGFAILGVLIFHAGQNFQTFDPRFFGTLISQGARGVQLFYVMSALTLFLSFASRSKNEKHPIRNFYIRRFFRIAPLFYLAIIYYLWQHYFFGSQQFISFANILATFTFVNGLSPYWINSIVPGGWSIAVEMTFYLFLPLFFYYLRTFRRVVVLTITMAIGMQILRLYLLTTPLINDYSLWKEFTFLFFPSQLPVFLIGVLTYFLIKEKNMRHFIKVIVIFFAVLVVQFFSQLPIIAGHYIYGFVFLIVCVLLSRYPNYIFVNPFSCLVGKISFSLYISHFAVLFWLNYFHFFNFVSTHSILNYVLNLLILIFLSTIVSLFLYLFIELPGQRLGKKIIAHFFKS